MLKSWGWGVCRWPCGDVQAAMWWGGWPMWLLCQPKSLWSWLWDFGLWDFGPGLDNWPISIFSISFLLSCHYFNNLINSRTKSWLYVVLISFDFPPGWFIPLSRYWLPSDCRHPPIPGQYWMPTVRNIFSLPYIFSVSANIDHLNWSKTFVFV